MKIIVYLYAVFLLVIFSVASKSINKEYSTQVDPSIKLTTKEIITNNQFSKQTSRRVQVKPVYNDYGPIVFPEYKEPSKLMRLTIEPRIGLSDIEDNLIMDIPDGKVFSKHPYTDKDHVNFKGSKLKYNLVNATAKPTIAVGDDVNKFLMDVPVKDCPPGSCRVDGTCTDCG